MGISYIFELKEGEYRTLKKNYTIKKSKKASEK